MEIVFWGARGSIPVSGPEYVRYGGETACVEVRNDHGGRIILDAGTGIRRLGAGLLGEQTVQADLFFYPHPLGSYYGDAVFSAPVSAWIQA